VAQEGNAKRAEPAALRARRHASPQISPLPTGQSLDEAAAVVVEDLERAAAALGTRTAPLVPACGVLVAAAGLLLKAEFSDGDGDVFLGLAVLSAVVGLSFLTRAHFIYAGRRTIGLPLLPGTSPSRATALSASTRAPTAAAGWPGSAWPA
jgi:hypothetical protein